MMTKKKILTLKESGMNFNHLPLNGLAQGVNNREKEENQNSSEKQGQKDIRCRLFHLQRKDNFKSRMTSILSSLRK